MSRDVAKEIQDTINSNRVVLFMKGNKSFPMCGFSAAVLEVLRASETPFETVNVLEDQEIRQGIKEFSDWPTIPQLYVDGQFVGGCDIVREMHSNGQLAPLLESKSA